MKDSCFVLEYKCIFKKLWGTKNKVLTNSNCMKRHLAQIWRILQNTGFSHDMYRRVVSSIFQAKFVLVYRNISLLLMLRGFVRFRKKYEKKYFNIFNNVILFAQLSQRATMSLFHFFIYITFLCFLDSCNFNFVLLLYYLLMCLN